MWKTHNYCQHFAYECQPEIISCQSPAFLCKYERYHNQSLLLQGLYHSPPQVPDTHGRTTRLCASYSTMLTLLTHHNMQHTQQSL